VEATVNVDTDEAGVRSQALEFATDCLNQGGTHFPMAIQA
jgi:hypothetical protein